MIHSDPITKQTLDDIAASDDATVVTVQIQTTDNVVLSSAFFDKNLIINNGRSIQLDYIHNNPNIVSDAIRISFTFNPDVVSISEPKLCTQKPSLSPANLMVSRGRRSTQLYEVTANGWDVPIADFHYEYKLFKTKTTFAKAESSCRSVGGHLVSDPNVTFHDTFLKPYVHQAAQGYGVAWIGGSFTSKVLTWTDGSHSSFPLGMPLKTPTITNGCVVAQQVNGLWDIIPCTDNRVYICKRRRFVKGRERERERERKIVCVFNLFRFSSDPYCW